ncbi:hypothetical protein K438DRAFT_1764328 [Mycena galopus ATCC 62051]|nr:hypothetical protein K438DRAFT_1764328 [Mycena galopus ATCC 62051]
MFRPKTVQKRQEPGPGWTVKIHRSVFGPSCSMISLVKTSKTGDPFLGVTGHYIHAPADSPEDWTLKSEQLVYTPIEGNHSGAYLSKILGRDSIVGWFTADNATNDTALKAFGKEVDALKLHWDPVEHRVSEGVKQTANAFGLPDRALTALKFEVWGL